MPNFLTPIGHFAFIALEVLLIFNVVIIVHELGHFLAARWRGLYVEEFAVWFGKPIWRKKFGGVWYALNSIPAGGYVKLPQMAPMDSIEGQSEIPLDQLKPVKPLDKIIVAFAGPLFSFMLALLLATVVWKIGKPVLQPNETTVIGHIEESGPAARAGLQVGDKILEIDGKPVRRFMGTLDSVVWHVMSSEGETILFKVQRGDQVLEIPSGWTKEKASNWRRPSLRKVMIGPLYQPYVHLVANKSPGAKAGLKSGDLVVSVAGQPVTDVDDIFKIVAKRRGENLPLEAERDGQKITGILPVPATSPKPGDDETLDLGVEWGKLSLDWPGPWEQVTDSVKTIVNMVTALSSSGSDVKASHFSGPVGIMNLYYRIFDAEEGWRLAIAFSVFFNVNLALLNMLPIPVLDGGHITLAIIESIRRKPVGGRWVEIVNTACALLLIGFMAFVTFFDLGDLFGKDRKEKLPEKPPAAEPGK